MEAAKYLIAGLLGASPGASTATSIMLDLLKRCFTEQLATEEWQTKLKEIIHSDFNDISSLENQLNGYNTCLFCMGVSSVGMNEEDYTKTTHS